jgi:hypothetical protein
MATVMNQRKAILTILLCLTVVWGPWLYLVFSQRWQPFDACRFVAVILFHGVAIGAICVALVRAGMEPAVAATREPGVLRVELWVRRSQRRTWQ